MVGALTQLAVGEALVSCLDAQGRPCITERVFVLPPGSRIGPVTPAERQALMSSSLVSGVYDTPDDRESAYEKLKGRASAAAASAASGPATATPQPAPGGDLLGGLKDALFGSTGPRGGRRQGLAEAAAASAVRSIGSTVGRAIARGLLGSLLGGRRR